AEAGEAARAAQEPRQAARRPAQAAAKRSEGRWRAAIRTWLGAEGAAGQGVTSNADIVLDQFTRQAAPFANSAAMRDEDALRLLVEFSGAGVNDTVLDVACGPGLVVAAFAKACRQATGIDLTPAMIDKAREHAAALSLTNVAWQIGNVLPLPFADCAFSIVVSRFAFHHFPDPLAVLREMARVVTRPGRIVVADMVASDDPQR